MRLIDADAMRQNWLENGQNEYVYDTNAVLDSIDEQITIDPEDLRPKGRWVKVALLTNGFLCSECGHYETSFRPIHPLGNGTCKADESGNFYHTPDINYCPNCGAEMEV